jgi:hypothetical protein
MTVELFDDLPEEVRKLVERANVDLQDIQEDVNGKIDRIRSQADAQIAEVLSEVEQQQQNIYDQLISELEPWQNNLCRDGRFEEALVIYGQLKEIKRKRANIEPDPGCLTGHQEIGRTYSFDVVGDVSGAVYGTDLYTTDSALAAAAVHAGVLRPGERGIVKVTIFDTSRNRFAGTQRRGVTSYEWDSYPLGYRIVKG